MDLKELFYSMKFKQNYFLSIKSIVRAVFIMGNKNALFLIRLFQISNKMNMLLISYVIRNRLVKKYGIFISSNTIIESGLILPHQNGMIFGDNVVIGKNTTIFQQVTIGTNHFGKNSKVKYPFIENNCVLSAGSKILGDIHVFSNTTVGANAVLISDTIDGSAMVGIPAKRVR